MTVMLRIWKLILQDDMGWTALMIAASVKESEKLVEFLLSKGADPNEKSELLGCPRLCRGFLVEISRANNVLRR